MRQQILINKDNTIVADIEASLIGYNQKAGLFVLVFKSPEGQWSFSFVNNDKKVVGRSTKIINETSMKETGHGDYTIVLFNAMGKKMQIGIKNYDENSAEVLGFGEVKFTNNSLHATSTIKHNRFIPIRAGVGKEDKAVYNWYNIDKGEFILDEFAYNISDNTDTETIDVQTHNGNRNIVQYDYKGNLVDKESQKTIVYAKDKIRKVEIFGNGKSYIYWLVQGYSREYTIYKDYDYDKKGFVGPICTFDIAHSYYNETGISTYGRSSHTFSDDIIFKQREWNTIYKLVGEKQTFVFRDFDYNLCKLVDNGKEMESVVIYSPKSNEEGSDFGNLYIGDNGTLYISALEPVDKKIHVVREDGTIIRSDDCYSSVKRNYGYSGYYIRDIYTTTDRDLDLQGYFKKSVKRDDTSGYDFLRFIDGKIEEIKLIDDVIDVHDDVDKKTGKTIITIVGDNKKVYKYDDKFNLIETPDLQTVAVQGMYMTLDRSEDICYVSQFSEDLKRYSIGKYRPKQVKEALRMSLDRNNDNQLIAFYATRLDENGNEKWSFFCVNGENGSKPENGMFQIGEFDSIELRHKGWWSDRENEIISCSSKSDFANNIFICKNEGEETKYLGIGFNEDGTMRLVKKRPVE